VSSPGYHWRHLTGDERAELLAWRQQQGRPWHSPPHLPNFDALQFHITAACHEHRPHIGLSRERMDEFSTGLLAALSADGGRVSAWCVLPNHYHALVETQDLPRLLRGLGRFHGRTSHTWNGQERTRGRQVFFRAVDRAMRSDAHVYATLNYVHHNPVHHGYVERWTDWPRSSAAAYVAQVGRNEAARVWQAFPVRDYGKGWDEPGL
jgi:putative transposase